MRGKCSGETKVTVNNLLPETIINALLLAIINYVELMCRCLGGVETSLVRESAILAGIFR